MITLHNWKEVYSNLNLGNIQKTFKFWEFYNLLEQANKQGGIEGWYNNSPKFREECDFMFGEINNLCRNQP